MRLSNKNSLTGLAGISGILFGLFMTTGVNAIMISDTFTASGSARAGSNVAAQTYNETDNLPDGAAGNASDDDLPSDASSESFGNSDGRYFATAELFGNGQASASIQWTRTVKNDSPDPVDIYLDVFLYGGGLQIGNNQSASYDWSIEVSGDVSAQTLLDSAVMLDSMSGLSESGDASVLDADGGGFAEIASGPTFYSWGSLSQAGIHLGQLEALNDELVITYLLTTNVTGSNTGIEEALCGGYEGPTDDIGVFATAAFIEEVPTSCLASVFTGDPNRIGGSNQITAIPGTPTNPIPEPTSLALIGLGLFGSAVTKRARN